MSQRVAKMESLIQQVVATGLIRELGSDAAAVTVTRVDAAPDLKHAIVWVGLLGNPAAQDKLWKLVEERRPEVQAELAGRLTTKFVPRIQFRRDTGGEYAEKIERLLKGL